MSVDPLLQPKMCLWCGETFGPGPGTTPYKWQRRRYCDRACVVYASQFRKSPEPPPPIRLQLRAHLPERCPKCGAGCSHLYVDESPEVPPMVSCRVCGWGSFKMVEVARG